MGDSIPFDSLSAGTGAGTEVGDGVIWDSIPFDSLAVGTETGTEVGNGVICDAMPFDSLAAETEEPAPQSPQSQSRSRSRRQAHPASGAPSHFLPYELGQPLQSPCPCF